MKHPIQNVKPVNQPRTTVVTDTSGKKEVYRFNEQSLQALASQLPKPGIDNETTPLKAGMLIGIQMVLVKLREGFTV